MVWMDTGDVQAYSPANCLMMMGMMCMMPNPDAAAAAAFNAKDHARTDANFDMTALARFEPTATEATSSAMPAKRGRPISTSATRGASAAWPPT